MSQVAIIEINNTHLHINTLNNKPVDNNIFFDTHNLYSLPFFKKEKEYVNIVSNLETRELDMLIFDYELSLTDYDKIYDIISPLFKAVMYFIENGVTPKNIRLFISEDCNVEYEDFAEMRIDYKNIKKSFIDFVSAHDILKTNCFPPIMFIFG